MFGRSLLLLLAVTFFNSCAKPNYLSPQAPRGGTQAQKLSACQARFASGHCAALDWETAPSDSDFGSFLFKTFRPNAGDGSPIEVDLDGTATVVLWMPGMGHGSSPVTVERLDVGTYRARNVFFVMKGDWEVRIQLKDGNEIKDQAIIPISL
jgi:YtkA-like